MSSTNRRWTSTVGAAVAVLAALLQQGRAGPAAEVAATQPAARPAAAPATQAVREGEVVVARVTYGSRTSSPCFSDGFLSTVANETRIAVRPSFAAVDLASPDLFQYPFVVLAGEGRFSFSDAERANLRAYVQRGGFVLASAGCSDPAWAGSFREELGRVLPGQALEPLPLVHAVFTTGIYRIAEVRTKVARAGPAIYGVQVGGQLRLVFAPVGLNDTASAGGGCCCCGGNEIRNARDINANILVYALTH